MTRLSELIGGERGLISIRWTFQPPVSLVGEREREWNGFNICISSGVEGKLGLIFLWVG